MSRFVSGRCLAALALVTGLSPLLSAPALAIKPKPDLQTVCRHVGTDRLVRAYEPGLRQATLAAQRRQYPQAQAMDEAELAVQASYRCYRGKTLVCFAGANLPCAPMNTRRVNKGASAYCRQEPNAPDVPAAAAGHDTIYGYRCRKGKAVITGTSWELDSAGFAKSLWFELPPVPR